MRAICIPLLLVLGVALCGCGASEELLSRSGPTPGWVADTPRDTAQELRFRGLSVGRNVLSESLMHSRAMDDARRQIAETIQTRIGARSTDVTEMRGSAARGQDEITRAEFSSVLRTAVQEQVRRATERARYHERWRIDPGLFTAAFDRYKYYVLVGYPREEYERQIERFLRLQNERRRARELLQADQPERAIDVLEGLLEEFPLAAVALRLQLAEACRRAGHLARAEDILEQALACRTTGRQEDRLREALQRVQQTFPEVPVEAVKVLYDTASDMPLQNARTVVPGVLTRAGFRVRGVQPGSLARLRPEDVRGLVDGAEWLVAVRIERPLTARHRSYYDLTLHAAAAESTVRIHDLSGAVLGAASVRANALRSSPDEAVQEAADASLHRALRQALMAAASNGE
jgi:hypothetical protein